MLVNNTHSKRKKMFMNTPKLILLLSGILFLMNCSNDHGSKNNIEAIYTSTSPVIDGDLNDPVWQKASPVVLRENRSGNNVSDTQLTTQVMTCYDDNTLYIAYRCNDPDIWTSFTQRDEHLWEEEAVEVFIDVDDVVDTYVEIEVSPANILFDSYIVDTLNIDVEATARFQLQGIKTAVKVNGTLNKRDDKDKSWTVEIALPFDDLKNENIDEVTSKTAMKLNFYRLDKSQGMERGAYAWSPTGARFHKPSTFGRLIFK